MGKIRIGIVGYGNIGRGVEQSIKRNDDMELKAVFTRRDPASVKIQTEGAEVKHFDDMEAMKDEIDVMILCGGSATDLPVIGPKVAASFNTIDSFDTHAKIPEYFANVDKAAKEGKNVSIISVGWDILERSLSLPPLSGLSPPLRRLRYFARHSLPPHRESTKDSPLHTIRAPRNRLQNHPTQLPHRHAGIRSESLRPSLRYLRCGNAVSARRSLW